MEKIKKTLTHPLQTAAWAEFRKAMGVTVVKISSGYVSFHKIPYTPWTVGYFPKGPQPTSAMIKELQKIGKEQHAVYVQLEPNSTTKFASLRPSHHPLFTKYTFLLDLTKSEDELLKAMHSKTRYNIHIAEKHGVTIREDTSEKGFEEYLRLEKETTDRQGYYAHNTKYHREMWRVMKDAGIAHLFTATYEGEILAAWIIFVHDGVMYYPYGASSRSHRDVMAPNLLLWELMKWGKTHGIHTFDLWGAMGPDPDVKDPWYGFHRFKTGYNPTLVEFAGSYDLVIKPILYSLYCIADSIRWSFLKLLK
ncbi:MAG: peptidoglycan bridge formation glycyltransferase FemA/FemB family protein [Candidatus Gottesmanbacteria bacterium]